jgi:MerR HTH family regulatory protein
MFGAILMPTRSTAIALEAVMPRNSDYLSSGRVAAILHVTDRTIRYWAAMGLISFIRDVDEKGNYYGHHRFHKDEIRRLAQEMGVELPPDF